VHRGEARAQRERVDPSVVGVDECARTHVKRLHPLSERLEGRRNVGSAPYFEQFDINANFSCCGLNLRHLQDRAGIADIADDRQSLQMGERLAQHFESLAGKFSGLNGETGRVSTRSRQ